MAAEMTRLQTLAAEARAVFHQATRTSSGDSSWTYDHDGADTPPWLQDLCMAAHDSMAPDDWRYAFIVEALDALAENDNPDDIEPEADVYTHELCQWLASHGHRPGYCDEATEEYGHASGIVETMQAGQIRERREVLDSVRSSLEAMIAEEEEAEEEADDDDDQADEPEEEDLITEDHITFYQHGPSRTGPVFTVQEGENWPDAAARWMTANRFYPAVWWISDHGNAHRMSMDPDGPDDTDLEKHIPR